MITSEQQAFLEKVYKSAVDSGHIYPKMVACEAALESSWGASELAKEANNLFGRKVWAAGPDVITIPTKEFLHGAWTVVNAFWKKFPTYTDCLKDRMSILQNDARYKAAVSATTPEDYIAQVSKVWSTDPNRGNLVLGIYKNHAGSLV
jgi:flagellum-specific peptidoglycan hydrolase FlgJ